MSAIDKLLEWQPAKDSAAVVLLSGGQDSLTTMLYAIAKHDVVYALGFQYGQRHNVELECAQRAAHDVSVPFRVLDMTALSATVTSALTGPGNVSEKHKRLTDLPASFVPGRNAMFLTLAHAYAAELGADYVYSGMCQTDFSGYPDCRRDFVDKMEMALNVGYEADIDFITPLMYIDKAQTFELADRLGHLVYVIENSHTCYNGERFTRHDWGYGCGTCPACKLRADGYNRFRHEAVSPPR